MWSIITLNFLAGVMTRELVWRYDTNIKNKQNWLGGDFAIGCKGLQFAPINTAPINLDSLVASQIILPRDGNIFIKNGAYIEFRENRKCIKLKPLIWNDYYDPSSWQFPQNSAVPDKERIPCEGDQIIVSEYYHQKSMSKFLESMLGNTHEILYKNSQGTNERICESPYGCLCHKQEIPCYPNNKKKLNCLYPIVPENSCSDICGAYMTYDELTGPDLKTVNAKLKEYSSDTHASLVEDFFGNRVVQIVFSEAEFSGTSLEEADNFHKFLSQHHPNNLQLFKSGMYYVNSGPSTISMIFISLLIVVLAFGIIFYVYGDSSIWNALQNQSVPFLAQFRRYDENLIIEAQSESGSVVDLPKSFENPLFDQQQQIEETDS